MLMLNLSGLTLEATQKELIELELSMTNGIMSYDDILTNFSKNSPTSIGGG